MKIEIHSLNGIEIVEVITNDVIINTAEDAVDLMGNLYFKGYNRIAIHIESLTPDFFDLKNGIAGEILQKFSNYRICLSIVGDISLYSSKSLKDFIYECNKGNHVSFVGTIDEAKKRLSA